MGGKKKTKWRKLPPEELSHITIKRRDRDATKLIRSYKPGESNHQQSSNGHNSETETGGYPCNILDIINVPNESSENVHTNELTENSELIEQSGFFVDGLWVPVSQGQNTDISSQVLPEALHTLPSVLHQSSSASSSAYPRFHTYHAPDVPFQSTFFVPNNNHYFYYLTRHQTKVANIQTTEQSNFHQNSANYSNSESSSGNVSISTDYASVSESQPVTDITSDVSYETVIENSQAYQCIKDQAYVTNLLFESLEPSHAAYQYPGYGFGQPAYNAPLYVLFPPVQSHAYPNSSWPAVHLKRRKKRRKGYAEYAVIPKKTNISKNFDNKETVTRDSRAKSNAEKNKQNTKEINLCKNSTNSQNCGHNNHYSVISSARKNKATELLNAKVNSNDSSNFAQNEVVSYANNLVENIIQQGIQKFASKFNHRANTFNSNAEISTLKETPENIKTINVCDINAKSTCILNETIEEPSIIRTSHVDNGCSQNINPELKHKKSLQNIEEFPQNVTAVDLLSTGPDEYNEKHLQTCTSFVISNNSLKHANFNSLISDDNKFTSSALDMDAPHVQKNVFSSPGNENIETYEKSKPEVNNRLTMKDRKCDPLSENAYILADTSSRNLKNERTEIEIRNRKFNDSIVQSRNDEVACDNSNISSNAIVRNNLKQKINATETRGKTASEINYVTTRNSILDNEHPENKHTEESPSSQCSFIPHSISSEVLIRETESELKKLHQLTSNANQAIYKLAYDENITDDISEVDDIDGRPSIHKVELTCPQSCKNLQPEACRTEIIVHEMDSGSDAGSEDVELLPHRYESDTARGCNKHIYVNNLSLAVELLRTRENLPYDDEFKMIVNDEMENQCEAKTFQNSKPILGNVNKGFVEDKTTSSNTFNGKNIEFHNHSKNSSEGRSRVNTVVNDEPQHKELRHSIADSGVQSEESEEDIGEEAKETFAKTDEAAHSTGANANFRRFGIQTRQRFNIYTPRTNVMNPCFCCIIM